MRIVCQHCLDPDQDGIIRRAQAVRQEFCLCPADRQTRAAPSR
jgi:hypothetical protein